METGDQLADWTSLSKRSNNFVLLDSSKVGQLIRNKYPSGYQLSDRTFICGRAGTTSIAGFNVAFLGGQERQSTVNFKGNNFDFDDLSAFSLLTEPIDILLTDSVPSLLTSEIKSFIDKNAEFPKDSFISYSLNLVIAKLDPKFIFSATGCNFSFETSPMAQKSKSVRFVHLSNFPTASQVHKFKYAYALSTEPLTVVNEYEKTTRSSIFNGTFSRTAVEELRLQINLVEDELFVGNVNKNASYEEIYEFLSKFGEVDRLEMGKVRGKFGGYVYAKFSDRLVSDQLLKESNEYSLLGQKIVFDKRVGK